jgi:peptide/nickel transport system substrate-binding protein
VRQAIAYCLDRPAIAAQLTGGLAEVPPAYAPAAHPAYTAAAVTQYPFDPARGQALLDQAGWQDHDGDGVRDDGHGAGGRKLSLAYASGPEISLFRQTLATLIQSQLLVNCGIEVRPQFYAQEDLYNLWPTGVLFGRKFDLGEFPWRSGIEPPCELYLTEAIPTDFNPGGANDTGYSNPAFDAACRAARDALDEATRTARHAEALALFAQDLPSLPLFTRLKIGVALPRVSGYQLDATADSDLWNIETIGLPRP